MKETHGRKENRKGTNSLQEIQNMTLNSVVRDEETSTLNQGGAKAAANRMERGVAIEVGAEVPHENAEGVGAGVQISMEGGDEKETGAMGTAATATEMMNTATIQGEAMEERIGLWSDERRVQWGQDVLGMYSDIVPESY